MGVPWWMSAAIMTTRLCVYVRSRPNTRVYTSLCHWEHGCICCVLAPGVVVEWVNEHQEQLLPYDVRVTAPGGKVTYIEVKTVSGMVAKVYVEGCPVLYCLPKQKRTMPATLTDFSIHVSHNCCTGSNMLALSQSCSPCPAVLPTWCADVQP
jgi:hypothetical protein